jgi:capsular polysaccharide biosynthesis protein
MKTRAAVRQAAITRVIRAAEAAGWARGSFKVVVSADGQVTLLPVEAAADEAADLERRMNEAFH